MKLKLTIAFLLISFIKGYSQVDKLEVYSKSENGKAKFIKFDQTKILDDEQAINIFLKTQFKADSQNEFQPIRLKEVDDLGFTTLRLQQYYKGVKVEFAIFNTVSQKGVLKSVNGNFVDIQDLSIIPKLSSEEALQQILKDVGAQKYIWQDDASENELKEMLNDQQATYYPDGELVIIEADRNGKQIPVLAYKFDIYAMNPLSRANYYVDATNGELILKDAILKHTEGPAATRYSGQRLIETTYSPFSGKYRLFDLTRGNGIHTKDMEGHGSNYNNSDDLLDLDNNWTSEEYNNINHDNALLDAHWGAMKTYDYFSNVHGRNSIDNNGFVLRNYVNANLIAFGYSNNDNAFWDGNRMTYGIGSSFGPLVSIDIVAHEIGHGLDQFSSDLIYQNESGAIDESLSDIWGAMVEYYAAPEKNTYLIAEDIGYVFRSLANPKIYLDPDTYQGDYWVTTSTDNGGVHTNSGVMNHWFYLLAEGSALTDEINDNDDVFSIEGLGKLDASKIVYRAQTIYFTPNTTYLDARNYTVQAAEDIFGVNSTEAITTNNAWYAVGIGSQIAGLLEGDDCVCYNPTTTLTFNNFANQSVSWQSSSNIQILSSNDTSVTIRAVNNATRGTGYVTANVGGEQITKNIWVGKPSAPSSLYGPTNVRYGAVVNYSGSSVQGATSYKWYLPYPYDQNASVTVDPTKWGILSGGTSRYLNAIAGPNNGLVQFMGENKCGIGGAKSINVTISSTSSGGISPGGGNMPISSLVGEQNDKLSIYPNPVKDKLNVLSSVDTPLDVVLYDLNGKEVLRKKITKKDNVLDVSEFSNGVYFVQVIGQISAIKKIIVQN